MTPTIDTRRGSQPGQPSQPSQPRQPSQPWQRSWCASGRKPLISSWRASVPKPCPSRAEPGQDREGAPPGRAEPNQAEPSLPPAACFCDLFRPLPHRMPTFWITFPSFPRCLTPSLLPSLPYRRSRCVFDVVVVVPPFLFFFLLLFYFFSRPLPHR